MSTMPTSFVPLFGFGDRVRKVRREVGLAQHDFAGMLGVNEKTVASWESGRTTPGDALGVAVRIQQIWGYSAVWLVGQQPERKPEPTTGWHPCQCHDPQGRPITLPLSRPVSA